MIHDIHLKHVFARIRTIRSANRSIFRRCQRGLLTYLGTHARYQFHLYGVRGERMAGNGIQKGTGCQSDFSAMA